MRILLRWTAAVVVAIGLLAAFSGGFAVLSSSFAKEVGPGEKAPGFKALPGVDGKHVGLSDLGDDKVVVISFTCNSCPVAAGYEDRCQALTKKYADQGVKFVAINVKSSENLDAMKARSDEKGFAYPYLRDDSQDSARAYGAKVTPHFFVLDQKRMVRYVGAFDDDMESPNKHYVADAVDALLAGKDPPVAKTDPVGCGIGLKKK